MSTTVGYGKSKGKAQTKVLCEHIRNLHCNGKGGSLIAYHTKEDDLENNSMGYGFI